MCDHSWALGCEMVDETSGKKDLVIAGVNWPTILQLKFTVEYHRDTLTIYSEISFYVENVSIESLFCTEVNFLYELLPLAF